MRRRLLTLITAHWVVHAGVEQACSLDWLGLNQVNIPNFTLYHILS